MASERFMRYRGLLGRRRVTGLSAVTLEVAGGEIWRALLDLVAQRGIGMLVVTHDEHLARRLAARRVEQRRGRIVATRADREAEVVEAATGRTGRRVIVPPE
jgi:ABC-type polar amino acid transport system ATPase subunit